MSKFGIIRFIELSSRALLQCQANTDKLPNYKYRPEFVVCAPITKYYSIAFFSFKRATKPKCKKKETI